MTPMDPRDERWLRQHRRTDRLLDVLIVVIVASMAAAAVFVAIGVGAWMLRVLL